MTLKGKVAIITGGGGGIGTEIAKRFVAEGAKICITGRRMELLAKVAAELPSGSVVTCAADVSKPEDVERIIKTTLDFAGKLNVLVNNAAINPNGKIAELDFSVWQKVIDINLTGPFLMMKASIPQMIKAGGGSIVNVASLAGVRTLPAMPAYCASKAGLIMLTQQAALDYGPQKIRCNVVCPGGVRTPGVQRMLNEMAEKQKISLDEISRGMTRNIPLKRNARPENIASICAYLASDEAEHMTATVQMLDGGVSTIDASMAPG
jgi:NAD(P)-dependent dehydrogenase (short-subunit alcohol dehydrogenase family)